MVFKEGDPKNELYPYMRDYTSFLKHMERPLVGREKEMQQLMAAMCRPELCNAILLAEAGSGKALDDETDIPVADDRGYAKIKDLKVGDIVFDEKGKPTRILGVFPQGLKRAYKVTLSDGSSVVCNDEHLWSTRKETEQTASDQEYITVPLRYMIDHLHEDERWHIPKSRSLLRDKMPFGIDSHIMGDSIRHGSVDRIPVSYMLGSVSQRYDLLLGLMGNDTHDYHVMGQDFNVLSTDLEADAIELITSLGMRAIVTDCKCHTIHIIGSDTEHDDIAIADITDLGYDCEMTCIYVDSPSHLFQCTKRHIVTHNTALVQGTMAKDTERAYLEVDLPRMISNLKNENEMADKLKQLFNEVEKFRKDEGKEVVLFIDEFHQIVQLSPAAVEVLKPLLADSGTRGIRVIAATTYIEFQQYIASNLPLIERLQRINLAPPDKATVISILRGMADRYGVGDQFKTDGMFEEIYDCTNRYIPANAQPRKSILMLDSMIGWHRLTGNPIDKKMLADVIYETEGVNIAFRVDATKIKAELDAHVLSQQYATKAIENRLQICCADLNNKNKPMSSFLFTGSTGTGKSTTCSTPIPVYTEDAVIAYKLAGEVQPGDYVFDRNGKPTKVLGVFPQGKRDVYRVTFGDGRQLDVSDNHLWAVYPVKKPRDKGYTIYTTQTLINKGLSTKQHGMKFLIPMNGAVEWAERKYQVHPYVMGIMLGKCFVHEDGPFTLSSDDEFIAEKVADLIGASSYESAPWRFYKNESEASRSVIQLSDICSDPGIYGECSDECGIPDEYMTGSIEQRWDLLNGLFDTDGMVSVSCKGEYYISYPTFSQKRAYDVQKLLYSLGVSSEVDSHVHICIENGTMRELIQYDVHVCPYDYKEHNCFSLPRKQKIAFDLCGMSKWKEKTFNYVGIRSIEKLDHQEEMVCFYVDNNEHLYQAGDFIVTHNTEMSKTLAEILFHDDRSLVRMDMTEYSQPDSLERFREELTRSVWTKPYCIVLLDEIEKACAPVTRLLLQVLDDGRLIDKNNREVTFKNAYIIITTNAGSEIYRNISQYVADDEGSGKSMMKYESLIRESISKTTGSRFPPELLGRIDCIVPFQPLSESTMKNICKMRLEKLRKEIAKKHRVTVYYDKRLIDYIVLDKMTTDSDAGGARAIVSRIDSEITMEISKFINSSPVFRNGRNIWVNVEGELVSENKNKLESSARITVSSTEPDKNKKGI